MEPGKRDDRASDGGPWLWLGGRGAETGVQRMTQSIGFGHDGGTLLQGGTSSTRSSSKAGMEWKWKGVGIRWKGMKRGVRRRRRKQKREREREREKRVREQQKDMGVPELDS